MKQKIFTLFIISLIFVLCGAGCDNVAGSGNASNSYGGGNLTGGGYTPPAVDNNPIVCTHIDESGKSMFAYEHVGEKPNPGDNGNKWHYHRALCKFCGYETTGWCTNSFNCNECDLKSASQNGSGYDSYDNKAQFIQINEIIKTIVIVANKEFEGSTPLTDYISHKRSKNFEIVEKYYPTRTTAESIRRDLKTIYQEQKNNSKNMCVLIVGRGGGEYQRYGIPEFENKNQWRGYRAATDFWYGYYGDSTTELFPDVAVGRLSASSISELQAQVNKIIAMETTSRSTNKNIVLVQQKKSDGTTPFSDEPIAIKKYFEKNYGSQYTIKETFTLNPSEIISAINSGALLVSYSGHGGTYFWGDSKFDRNTVKSLSNSFYPIVLGVTCHSANYTDGDACLAEAFMRKSNGGAVGYIGASQAMIAYYSKAATIGNDNVPGMISSLFYKGTNNYKVKTLGGIFLAALRSIKMSKTYPISNAVVNQQAKDYCIEILNLFGDPTFEPYIN